MKITYIHHSCFLAESERFYYLFDYEKGNLPELNRKKPIYVFSSHSHHDHYNPEIFSLLKEKGMQNVRAVLSDDIKAPAGENVLLVAPKQEYQLEGQRNLHTLRSTDLGVAFLLEEDGRLLYHAGDLNDWVWEEENDSYNEEMTANYRRQIQLLSETLNGREIDTAFVVLDPRQEKDYDRGLCYFLEQLPVKAVYPMHYWGKPEIIDTFLKDHPEHRRKIQRTE